MNKHLVSILIPLYNSEKYISETIQSALSQTWQNIEIIIVDDHSTDNSYYISKSFESDIVKLYKNPRKGACAARNFAFEKSTGSFIQYLDADDLLSPNKIERQLGIIQPEDEDTLLFCAWSHFWNEKKEANLNELPIYKNYNEPIELLIDMFEGNYMITNQAWLTPRNLIKKIGCWDELLQINQDGEFFARAILASKSIKYCPNIMVYYRQVPNYGISRSVHSNKIAQSALDALDSIHSNLLLKNNSNKVKKIIVGNYAKYIYKYYKIYPNLIELAKFKIKGIKQEISFNQFSGFFKILVLVFGFWNALKIRFFIKNVTK